MTRFRQLLWIAMAIVTGTFPRQSLGSTPHGYEYFELRGGLLACREKFEKEKRGRVAFLGGSITAMTGWRDKVCDELRRRFPETEFDFVNAGISSLGSTPGAFRFQRDVLANGPVDLLFEEAAVNDDTNGFSTVEQIRGMEGIVRQALISNPNMDVVLLHFVDPGKIEAYRAGKKPSVIVNHERVAQHYGVASINLALEVTERLDAGEFSWEKDFVNLHPSPFGHDLYAKSIARLFTAAWEATPRKPVAMRPALVPPLDPASYFDGRLVSPTQLIGAQQAQLGDGWSLDPSWHPPAISEANPPSKSRRVGTRPGFVDVPVLVADQPGATMKLRFHGRGIGVFVAAGPDTGNLDFRVDAGPWESMALFTQWSPSLHLPWAKMLASELDEGPHELELRVAQISDVESQGHAIRIVHFLVNGKESK